MYTLRIRRASRNPGDIQGALQCTGDITNLKEPNLEERFFEKPLIIQDKFLEKPYIKLVPVDLFPNE